MSGLLSGSNQKSVSLLPIKAANVELTMDLDQKMALLADLFELDVNEFTPETILDDLEEWDSLAAISYVVMMDEEFSRVVDPADIKEFQTVQDILDSMTA